MPRLIRWWHRSEPAPRVIVHPRLLLTGQQIVAAFRSFGLVEVILFGSRAYGRPAPDSDADFLLIANPLPTPADVERMAATLANDLETEFGFLPQIFPKTPDEVRAELLRVSPSCRSPFRRGSSFTRQGGLEANSSALYRRPGRPPPVLPCRSLAWGSAEGLDQPMEAPGSRGSDYRTIGRWRSWTLTRYGNSSTLHRERS